MAHKRGRVWRAIRNSPGIQIALYFIAFTTLIAVYTYIFHAYYPVLEKKPLSWAEALLFVVESMTTVGYGELGKLTNDLTMLLSIQIMLSGVIMIFIVVPLLLAPFLTTLLAPTPPRKTPHVITGHTVIMGYDELTRAVIDSLAISDHDVLIIEQDKAKALEMAALYRRRAYVIWGQYTNSATWDAAHISRAGYIVISKDERITANIVLGIRSVTRGKIISVVDKLSFDRYLRYAGADYVLSPKDVTGRILARHAALGPGGDTASDISGAERNGTGPDHRLPHELRLVHLPVGPVSGAAARTLGSLGLFERYGILVLSLWRSGIFVAKPGADEIIDRNSSLFLFGSGDAIAAAIHDEFSAGSLTGDRAVIAGYGDVGKAAYRELVSAGISCRVIDSRKHDVDQVIGDAEDEEVLKRAHIEEARFCIVALNSDDVNIFTTLMARNLNPGIRILARANEPASVDKLYRAGADYVALLPTIGGQTIGRIVLADSMTILLDLPDGEMVVMKHVKRAKRRSVGWYRKKTGARIIGIESANRSVISPDETEILLDGDAVFAVGDTEQLKKFFHLI